MQPQSRRGGTAGFRRSRKYGKLVQMGTQQRVVAAHHRELWTRLPNGLIGNAFYAKAWYSNNAKVDWRLVKEAPVPAQLDWDLWQGPAPRRVLL